MNIFLEEHQNILSRLIENHVEFLLIGGYAVIFHGYARSTGDMDIWVRPVKDNKLLLIKALHDYGYDVQDLKELYEMDFTKHMAYSIGNEPEKIEFINYINLVSFEEAVQNQIVYDFDGLTIPFINIRELILSKMNTGRKKDEADIEELQKIINYKKDHS
jgi:predicted nucleotidyltransferase